MSEKGRTNQRTDAYTIFMPLERLRAKLLQHFGTARMIRRIRLSFDCCRRRRETQGISDDSQKEDPPRRPSYGRPHDLRCDSATSGGLVPAQSRPHWTGLSPDEPAYCLDWINWVLHEVTLDLRERDRERTRSETCLSSEKRKHTNMKRDALYSIAERRRNQYCRMNSLNMRNFRICICLTFHLVHVVL